MLHVLYVRKSRNLPSCLLYAASVYQLHDKNICNKCVKLYLPIIQMLFGILCRHMTPSSLFLTVPFQECCQHPPAVMLWKVLKEQPGGFVLPCTVHVRRSWKFNYVSAYIGHIGHVFFGALVSVYICSSHADWLMLIDFNVCHLMFLHPISPSPFTMETWVRLQQTGFTWRI